MKWIAITYYIISVAFAAHIDYAKYNETTDVSGWMLKAFFDLTQGDNCPSPWYKVTVNGKMCRSPSDTSGCSSITYRTHGKEYSDIRGFIRGYQKGTTDGFRASQKMVLVSTKPMLMEYPLQLVILEHMCGPMLQDCVLMEMSLKAIVLVLLYMDRILLLSWAKIIIVNLVVNCFLIMILTLTIHYGKGLIALTK